jgi:ATP-dependent protease ClpP protease subunit
MSNDHQLINGESNTKTFFNITKKTKTVNNYEVYLNQSICMSDDVYRLLDLFRSASKGDTIKLYLNSPGGRLDVTLSILNAMSDCVAKIITIADGRVASACTFLFLAGDEKVIYDFSFFMFHQYSGGASGKGGEVRDKVDFTHSHYEKFFRHYYGNLFTDEEIQYMLYGKDKWIDKEGMEALLKKERNIVDKNKSK